MVAVIAPDGTVPLRLTAVHEAVGDPVSVIVDPAVRPALLPETVVQAIAVETCGFAPDVTDRSWNVIVYGWPVTLSMGAFAA